jgi:hypothetical protein
MADPSGAISGSRGTDMLFAGSEAAGPRALATDVVRGVGFSPIFVGPIRYARNLEAIAELWIHMAVRSSSGWLAASKSGNRNHARRHTHTRTHAVPACVAAAAVVVIFLGSSWFSVRDRLASPRQAVSPDRHASCHAGPAAPGPHGASHHRVRASRYCP